MNRRKFLTGAAAAAALAVVPGSALPATTIVQAAKLCGCPIPLMPAHIDQLRQSIPGYIAYVHEPSPTLYTRKTLPLAKYERYLEKCVQFYNARREAADG